MAQLNMYNCLIYNELYCAIYYGYNCFGAIERKRIEPLMDTNTHEEGLKNISVCPEESVDWETTQNLFIEGDNLEVLKNRS